MICLLLFTLIKYLGIINMSKELVILLRNKVKGLQKPDMHTGPIKTLKPIFYTCLSLQDCRGFGAYVQQSLGQRQGTPWTGRQSITGQDRTNNHAHKYERAI
ncbi:hypothetical protein ILYODFUR_018692 [Ilyodon furcidens]|uniref:Uncharacterized protein n=1 Tax=Ilyodon furcidens TaxID=33524 RepID=A0ABV0VF42_9TELE